MTYALNLELHFNLLSISSKVGRISLHKKVAVQNSLRCGRGQNGIVKCPHAKNSWLKVMRK